MKTNLNKKSVLGEGLRAAAVIAAFVMIAPLAQAQKDPTDLSKTAPAEPPAMAHEEHHVSASDTGSLTAPHVFFIEPKDGAVVESEFKVKFGLEGMKLAMAGELTPGSGHHHLIVDGKAATKGQVVPADGTHVHFGKGQTETTLKLAKGKHTLTLQFADGKHESYGEAMSQTIHITVK